MICRPADDVRSDYAFCLRCVLRSRNLAMIHNWKIDFSSPLLDTNRCLQSYTLWCHEQTQDPLWLCQIMLHNAVHPRWYSVHAGFKTNFAYEKHLPTNETSTHWDEKTEMDFYSRDSINLRVRLELAYKRIQWQDSSLRDRAIMINTLPCRLLTSI